MGQMLWDGPPRHGKLFLFVLNWQNVFREILLQHVTGHCGSLAQDLVSASRLVPLCKDSTGQALGPITTPSI